MFFWSKLRVKQMFCCFIWFLQTTHFFLWFWLRNDLNKKIQQQLFHICSFLLQNKSDAPYCLQIHSYIHIQTQIVMHLHKMQGCKLIIFIIINIIIIILFQPFRKRGLFFIGCFLYVDIWDLIKIYIYFMLYVCVCMCIWKECVCFCKSVLIIWHAVESIIEML